MIAECSCLLDARAGTGSHVNLELAGVYRGEEVLTKRRSEKPYRSQCKRNEEKQKNPGVVHAQGEQPQVAVTKRIKT